MSLKISKIYQVIINSSKIQNKLFLCFLFFFFWAVKSYLKNYLLAYWVIKDKCLFTWNMGMSFLICDDCHWTTGECSRLLNWCNGLKLTDWKCTISLVKSESEPHNILKMWRRISKSPNWLRLACWPRAKSFDYSEFWSPRASYLCTQLRAEWKSQLTGVVYFFSTCLTFLQVGWAKSLLGPLILFHSP